MKYIKKFNTELSYNIFLESDNYKRPNISKIENKLYYNKNKLSRRESKRGVGLAILFL